MARTAMLTARVYPELKKWAETLFRSYGLSTSLVINALLSECVRTGEIPLELARNITHLKVTRSEYESYKHMDQATEEEMILLDPEEIIILDIVDDEDDKDAENEQESADAKDESAAGDGEQPQDAESAALRGSYASRGRGRSGRERR